MKVFLLFFLFWELQMLKLWIFKKFSKQKIHKYEHRQISKPFPYKLSLSTRLNQKFISLHCSAELRIVAFRSELSYPENVHWCCREEHYFVFLTYKYIKLLCIDVPDERLLDFVFQLDAAVQNAGVTVDRFAVWKIYSCN